MDLILMEKEDRETIHFVCISFFSGTWYMVHHIVNVRRKKNEERWFDFLNVLYLDRK